MFKWRKTIDDEFEVSIDLITTKDIEKLTDKIEELTQEYISNQISIDKYCNQMTNYNKSINQELSLVFSNTKEEKSELSNIISSTISSYDAIYNTIELHSNSLQTQYDNLVNKKSYNSNLMKDLLSSLQKDTKNDIESFDMSTIGSKEIIESKQDFIKELDVKMNEINLETKDPFLDDKETELNQKLKNSDKIYSIIDIFKDILYTQMPKKTYF